MRGISRLRCLHDLSNERVFVTYFITLPGSTFHHAGWLQTATRMHPLSRRNKKKKKRKIGKYLRNMQQVRKMIGEIR